MYRQACGTGEKCLNSQTGSEKGPMCKGENSLPEKLEEQMNGLLEKYTELLLGETDDQLKKQVEMWIVYTHIAKSMPALAKHWNATYPDAKQGIKEVIYHIKSLNEEHRKNEKG
jgi:hypothetical protein